MTAKKINEKKKDPHDKKIDSLQKELDKLKQELKEKDDKLLRSYADLQNYQKRIEKDINFKEEDIRKKYLLEIIDFYEILEKANKDINPKEGINAILQNIQNLLKKEQITEIECLDKPFDYCYHNAISTIEKENCDDGKIVDQIKKGYMIGNKILRPSYVIVVKNKKIEKKEGT
jgi:molecular chaperone GrpE